MSGKEKILSGLDLAITPSGDGLLVKVKVSPKSSKFEVKGVKGERIDIRLKSPPEKGKANGELISNLSKILNVRRNDLFIKSGEISRTKTVYVSSLTKSDLIDKILNQIA